MSTLSLTTRVPAESGDFTQCGVDRGNRTRGKLDPCLTSRTTRQKTAANSPRRQPPDRTCMSPVAGRVEGLDGFPQADSPQVDLGRPTHSSRERTAEIPPSFPRTVEIRVENNARRSGGQANRSQIGVQKSIPIRGQCHLLPLRQLLRDRRWVRCRTRAGRPEMPLLRVGFDGPPHRHSSRPDSPT